MKLWPFARSKTPQPPEPIDAAAVVRRARRLRYRVRPEAVAALSGAYHGARPGTGLTFAELRPYEPGDDVRHLDWNVTARQNRPYVRRYIEERSLSLWLIVDTSASLRFGPEGQTKADRAAQAAALLAAAAIHNGDRVGLALVSDRVECELAPSGGVRHLARLLRMLVAVPTSSRRSGLSAGLRHPLKATRRGLVVALGDFLEAEPVVPWRRVARRHDVIALRLVEPREIKLPDAGLIALEEAETGRSRLVDAGSKRVRTVYARAAWQRREDFRAWCAEARVVGHDVSTVEDPIAPLLRIFRGHAPRQGTPR